MHFIRKLLKLLEHFSKISLKTWLKVIKELKSVECFLALISTNLTLAAVLLLLLVFQLLLLLLNTVFGGRTGVALGSDEEGESVL